MISLFIIDVAINSIQLFTLRDLNKVQHLTQVFIKCSPIISFTAGCEVSFLIGRNIILSYFHSKISNQMKNIYFLVLVLFFSKWSTGQSTCGTAVPITVPYNSGALTTCGSVNDYAVGSYCAANYGAGEDYVFSLTITNAPVAYNIALGGGATWKIASVHSACPPTPANAIGCLTTSTGTSATANITFPTNGTYYIIIDTWPTPDCGAFTLSVTDPPAPAPANDNCTTPAMLTATTGLTCGTATAGTTAGATSDPTVPGTCVGNADDDVWYSFTATAVSHTVELTNVSGSENMAHQIFSGTCAGLTMLQCSDDNKSISNNLVIGQTYYVRVFTFVNATATFNICVYGAPPPPANNECSGAISLTPSAGNTCSTPTAGTTTGATQSAGVPDPSCSATGINDDVWYSFVATQTSHTIRVSNAPSTTALALYSGGCAGLTQVSGACASNYIAASSLTVGETYYVRVYTTSTASATFSTFDICVASPPVNDNCTGAITLTVSATNACTNATFGSTAGATASTETVPTCSATGVNDDVWYSFTATETSHTISIYNTASTSAVALYSGSCGGLTQVTGACGTSGAGGIRVNSLTVGNVYYIRVYTTSSTVGTISDFNICVGVLPSNNDCTGAIALTASSTTTCTSVKGSTIGATQSTTAAPSCSATGRNDDVWYSFVASNATQIIRVDNASATTAAAIYTGADCGSITQITGACASGGTTVSGLNVGDTYYIRVYTTSATATNYSTFDICVTAPPPPPANDDCANAVAISGVTNGTTVGATQSMAQEICGTATAASAKDVWYTFTATSNGSAIVDVTNVAADFDAVLMVYSGACGSLTNIGCADGPGAGGSETTTIAGLTAGTTYYARVYGYTAVDGSFSISVTGSAMPVELVSFTGSKQEGKNILSWSTVTERNNAGFELQRSMNGIEFSTIARINTKAENGNSNTFLHYQHIDEQPLLVTNYYRLKQTDRDGRHAFSNIVAIKGEKVNALSLAALYPNPVADVVNLLLESPVNTKLDLVVTDITGKVVMQQSATAGVGTTTLHLPVKRLSPGTYVIRVISEKASHDIITRFIKQ
jgi:trimeric autotransporter adhesin